MAHEQTVAVVTGAASGIGRALAAELLNRGSTVVLADVSGEAVVAAARELDQGRGRATAVAIDVRDRGAVDELIDGVYSEHSRLDLLFNNAGVSLPVQTPDEIDAVTWRRAVDTNLNGAFFCLSQAFTLMREQSPQGGRIVNNGSISAHAPRPGSMAYTATKHAVTGITNTAALDGRKYGIAVGQIDIGNVASDMTARMVAGVPQADGSIKPEPRMAMDSVVSTFMTMARLPLDSNILNVTVMASAMPFVGRG